MPSDALCIYLQTITTNLARGNATEHTHRPVLKVLLDSLGAGITVTNEPQHIIVMSNEARHLVAHPEISPRTKRSSK